MVSLACGQAVPGAGTPFATNPFPAETYTAQSPPVTGATFTPDGGQPVVPPDTGGTDLQAGAPILIGTEYVIIEFPNRVPGLAAMLAPLGLTAAKPLPDNFNWGQMQASPDAAINFERLDAFVAEFQAIGVTNFVLGMHARADWANNDVRVEGHFFPLKGGIKPEFLDEYAAWISAVVERYDFDGSDDMPGLRAPVRYYEIGVEFSTYEPEPVEEYLDILEIAYNTAHSAYEDVIVAHVAFLATPALFELLAPNQYESAFANLEDRTHPLSDMRRVLDHPELFDVLNIHSLGHPYEIEAIVSWLNYETGQRGYSKPIIISDTGSTPFIAWGPATSCTQLIQGRLVPPATEADRCRLADYFMLLVNGDASTLRWTQEFIAADTVKRVVVAAEQDIVLIDTAYTEDLILKIPLFQAGAGTAAWAGLVDRDRNEYRPVYYALQQVIDRLGSYDSITRLPQSDEGVRVYEVVDGGQRFWIAWYDPAVIFLPGESVPQISVGLNLGVGSVTVESLAISSTGGATQTLSTDGGLLTLTLDPNPVYIFP